MAKNVGCDREGGRALTITGKDKILTKIRSGWKNRNCCFIYLWQIDEPIYVQSLFYNKMDVSYFWASNEF